ncbi:SDR family NAD(P)-dependent oxidoreductase [Robertmurraya kyonggiensis]|uniref:SDR family NAD(P)-dependent oxidoreductase n=1 Tax=Robertmurraya kyonggiensis TaxID=1037680 RepID=A0A4U1D2N5_9BACI|nr:SDR family NAD(P)-dependent oxidoreductase [Robertmurraya kyonggiensis]TKC16078.1 SDR family NAD(P)-dependent oxidoreductase [Robertmurraya kyonggiensis]
MKKALVLGASGGMGYSIVKELSKRGIQVTAFARTKSKLDKLFKNDTNVTTFQGDIFQGQDIKDAAKGADVIFQAANIPYPEWEKKLETFMGNILTAAQVSGASLAIVDNIYAYGRSDGRKVQEDFPKNPHTKKGRIRLNVEDLVKNSDVKALIAHFPDFYGPNAENSILHFTLQGVVKNKRAMFVGNQQIKREFIFTPDGAKAIVNLALNENAYGQNWNIPGIGVISGKELVKIIRDTDNYEKGVSTITKNMIRFLGIFDPIMREVVEMFYLNEEPVVLDGNKYEQFIGELPRTSYREGLKQTLDYMKNIG